MAPEQNPAEESQPNEHHHTDDTRTYIVWDDTGERATGLNRDEAKFKLVQLRGEGKGAEELYAECSECADTIEIS